MINIEILYADNCPHYTKACEIICDLIAEIELDATIDIKKVRSEEDFIKFRGSPTVLINGTDVEMCFNEVNNLTNIPDLVGTVACRLYNCDSGIGCPSHEMVKCTLERILI